MKRLSDYKGVEAFELWADIIEPISAVFTDKDVEAAANSEDGTSMDVAKIALKKHADDVIRIFERIDPEPVTGANVMGRMLMLIADLMRDPVIAPFFGYAGRAAMAFVASGSAMENTAEDVK